MYTLSKGSNGVRKHRWKSERTDSSDGTPAKKGGKQLTSSFKSQEKHGVSNFVGFIKTVCGELGKSGSLL